MIMPAHQQDHSHAAGRQQALPGGGAHGHAAGRQALGARRTGHHGAGPFGWFAQQTAHLAGRPAAFIAASAVIAVWAASGPLFHYSDTWQLVINTGTTIVTFLMVFLIQNTQNRDTLAIQIKLAELIIAVRGAHNQVAVAEDMSDGDLEALHEAYRKRADEVLDSLTRRRASRASKRH
jgi:low affinity Fe/Cu permease